MNKKKHPHKPELVPDEVFRPGTSKKEKLSLYIDRVPAGFPSPAEDFVDKELDLNDYLIGNKSATFLVKVEGRSMENAGIFDGDVIVVDRSLDPENGKVVLGVLNGEFTVKRLSIQKNKLKLLPENPDFLPIDVSEEMDFKIWGVVTFSLHRL